MTRGHDARRSTAPAARVRKGKKGSKSAPTEIADRVFLSKAKKPFNHDVLHVPPGTKFYGDPATGSGKVRLPKRTRRAE